jgi:hypothetical protein
MFRLLGVAIAIVTGATCFAPAVAGPNDRGGPMRFELRQQGPVEGCPGACPLLISAAGAITSETPREFVKFVGGRDLRGAVVALDSDGGSVLGAIALGREIRRLNLATTVGRTNDLDTPAGAMARAALLPRADCESMCTFVLLAGVTRSVPPEARVMVHQIWLGDRRDDPTAVSYSAEDLVLVQRDIGRLARYTSEMGAPTDLLELSLRIPPWEPMHALTRDELRQMKLDTADLPAPSPPALANANPPPPPSSVATSGSRASAISDRRWLMVDRSGASALARRHPLTLEGEEIGRFDLVVTCAGADAYGVNYTEKRFGSDGKRAMLPVGAVTLRVGGQVATLKVMSSDKRDGVGEVDTFATGTVPAALIKAFTVNGPRSLFVTTSSGDLKTAIRLGNTGAAQNLPALAANCQTLTGRRVELEPQKSGVVANQ